MRGARSAAVAAGAWLLDRACDDGMDTRVFCLGEGSIRIDPPVLYPALFGSSVWALAGSFRPRRPRPARPRA